MIKIIIHLSDVHIRTLQYHDLYRKQFSLFFDEIREKVIDYDYDEIRIVIAGDLFHQKINISNEQILLSSWLLTELSKIGKVILIIGNHDFLEHNQDRIDTITPIVDLLKNPNVIYYKDSGIYVDDNISWVVYSLYNSNIRPLFKKEKNKLYIGLFHGSVNGCLTDLGYKFEDSYDRLNFIDCHIVLCGDIHKRQRFEISPNCFGVYPGSFIQQDFGETIKHHGYGIYNVETDIYKFYDINNEEPFMDFIIKDITDIDEGKEILVNLG